MIDKIEPIVKQICLNNGIGLYDIEVKNAAKGRILCIYITKIGGVIVEDCIKVNRELNNYLEEADIIQGNFFIEVSSPGIERALKYKKHYLSAINEIVKIQYTNEEKSEIIEGKLLEVLPEEIKVLVDTDEVLISFNSIKKARTVFHFGTKERS